MDDLREDNYNKGKPSTKSKSAKPPTRGGRADTGPAPGRTALVTTYRTNAAVTKRAVAGYAEWLEKTITPVAATQFKAMAASNDLFGQWKSAFTSDGYKTGDMADAFSAYWMTKWQMATGRTEVSPALHRAVAKQVRSLMASKARFTSLTEEQRQELSETLMINTIMQGGVYAQAVRRGDSDLQTRLGDAAAARFRNEMQVDLRALQLTDAGLQRRR